MNIHEDIQVKKFITGVNDTVIKIEILVLDFISCFILRVLGWDICIMDVFRPMMYLNGQASSSCFQHFMTGVNETGHKSLNTNIFETIYNNSKWLLSSNKGLGRS